MSEAKIQCAKVAEADRMEFLPSVFGPGLMMIGERMVYRYMELLNPSYEGGYWWEFYRLDNGGFYMAPRASEPMQLSWAGNGFDGVMSADAAGIVASMFAINDLCNQVQDEKLIDSYHLLRAFAAEHAEASLIGAAID